MIKFHGVTHKHEQRRAFSQDLSIISKVEDSQGPI